MKYYNEIKVFLAGLAMALNINVDIAVTLTILMFIDLFIGMIKYALVDELTFSKREAKKGFVVKSLVILLVFSIAIGGKALELDLSLYLNSFMKLFVINELFSIINNWRSIKCNKNIKTDDFIGLAIGKGEEKIRLIIDNFFKK